MDKKEYSDNECIRLLGLSKKHYTRQVAASVLRGDVDLKDTDVVVHEIISTNNTRSKAARTCPCFAKVQRMDQIFARFE